MVRFFQPSILLALVLAVLAGILIPLYNEKPSFFVKQKQMLPKLQLEERKI